MAGVKPEDEEKTTTQHDDISPPISSRGLTKNGAPREHGVTAVSAKLKNPLAGFTREELMADVEKFANEKELQDILPMLKKGAFIAQDPKRFEQVEDLDPNEREWLRMEKTHRWKQPWMMYFMTSKLPPNRLTGFKC